MGAWGGIVMSFFGAVFASMTLALQFGWRGIPAGVPFVVFATITLAATVTIRRPGRRIARSKRARRVILWSTIGEVLGLLLAANLVIDLGHRELLLPVSALVVGLHFLPMAYGIPFAPFYWLGFTLLLAATMGFALSETVGATIAGFSAAAALWVAAALALSRETKANEA